MANVTVVDTGEDLAATACERVATIVETAAASHGSAFVCLTGGRTPRRMYQLLADPAHPWATRLPWDRIHLFWGDERHVPPDHADSNFGMARTALLDRVPVPDKQVHRIRGEQPPQQAADAYDHEIRAAFAAASRPGEAFDVMLLGVGDDAHIASIFPGSDLLRAAGEGSDTLRRDEAPLVAAVWVPPLGAWRITLRPDAVLAARRILVLVSGESKAPAVSAALEGPVDPIRWPAQILRRAADRVEWIVDRKAASALGERASG